MRAEYFPPITVRGALLFGTNIWRFTVVRCAACQITFEAGERVQQDAEKADLAERRRLHHEARFREMVGPRPFDEFTFERFKATTPSQVSAEKFCRDFSPVNDNIFLWGPPGTGKTHLAIAAVRALALAGERAIVIKHPVLNRSMQGLSGIEYARELKRYVDAPILVVDDIGAAKQTEYADQVLHEILDGRRDNYRNGLILTSNLSLDELAANFGQDRQASRIGGFCRARMCRISGPDRRWEPAR